MKLDESATVAYADLELEHRGHVSWLYLARPHALNAISPNCMIELQRALITLRNRTDTRVVVLSGKGRAFCAGADLGESTPQSTESSGQPSFLELAQAMEDVLNTMPKPVIAAVNGICCGGGLEIAMMCDFIIAASSARIGDAHANFGAMPGGGSTARLPRLVGPNMARYMMFTGDLFTATEMAAAGLVTRVVEDGSLDQQVQLLAGKIADKSPLGLRRMKALIGNAFDLPLELAIKMEKLTSAEHMRSWDAGEGGRAFVEKRKPQFRGC